MQQIDYETFAEKLYSVKMRFIEMYYKANAGHIGSSLSCVDLLTYVFFNWMNDNDEFILSKGHAAACLYSVLAEKGIISEDQISSFYKEGTFFAAHPPANKIKKIPFATGSLGHGLSLAAGIAMGFKLRGMSNKVFCVTSDGETNEGSIWEAVQFINHHQLKNLIWFIDKNNLQGYGKTDDVLKNQLSIQQFESFGFNALIANGHDFESLENAKKQTLNSTKPSVIICNTIKGKGWRRLMNTVDCHYLPMNEQDYSEIKESFAQELEKVKLKK